MADKKHPTEAHTVHDQVKEVRTQHYMRLVSRNGSRPVHLPIADRNAPVAVDPMYEKYSFYTRVLVTVQYGDSTEVLKSGQLDPSEEFTNDNA
jgi:23S rRNA A2030 N6-methylase RlmJ